MQLEQGAFKLQNNFRALQLKQLTAVLPPFLFPFFESSSMAFIPNFIDLSQESYECRKKEWTVMDKRQKNRKKKHLANCRRRRL